MTSPGAIDVNLKSWRWDRWEVTAPAPGNDVPLNDLDWEALARCLDRPEAVIKHDHRSMVATLAFAGVRYGLKEFTTQSTWWWFQMTSALFPSLGEIAFTNGLALNACGLLTPPPILLLQRRRGGMVVQSRLVYRWLEGRTLGPGDADLIVEYLKEMHRKGWVHRDPHPANFILTPRGVATVDPLRVRRTGNPYLRAYDLVLLSHDLPEALKLYGNDGEVTRWLKAADYGHNMVRLYRAAKCRARRAFGIYSQSKT